MCQHIRTVGDNYGETCLDCGATLSGYGFWAEGSASCLHEYHPDGQGNLVCLYCDDFIYQGESQRKETDATPHAR